MRSPFLPTRSASIVCATLFASALLAGCAPVATAVGGNLAALDDGRTGLLVLDFFQGNRTPYRDERLRGAILGLDLHPRLAILGAVRWRRVGGVPAGGLDGISELLGEPAATAAALCRRIHLPSLVSLPARRAKTGSPSSL